MFRGLVVSNIKESLWFQYYSLLTTREIGNHNQSLTFRSIPQFTNIDNTWLEINVYFCHHRTLPPIAGRSYAWFLRLRSKTGSDYTGLVREAGLYKPARPEWTLEPDPLSLHKTAVINESIEKTLVFSSISGFRSDRRRFNNSRYYDPTQYKFKMPDGIIEAEK